MSTMISFHIRNYFAHIPTLSTLNLLAPDLLSLSTQSHLLYLSLTLTVFVTLIHTKKLWIFLWLTTFFFISNYVSASDINNEYKRYNYIENLTKKLYPSVGNSEGRCIINSNDNNFYLGGTAVVDYVFDTPRIDFAILKVSPSGELIWKVTGDEFSEDAINALIEAYPINNNEPNIIGVGSKKYCFINYGYMWVFTPDTPVKIMEVKFMENYMVSVKGIVKWKENNFRGYILVGNKISNGDSYSNGSILVISEDFDILKHVYIVNESIELTGITEYKSHYYASAVLSDKKCGVVKFDSALTYETLKVPEVTIVSHTVSKYYCYSIFVYINNNSYEKNAIVLIGYVLLSNYNSHNANRSGYIAMLDLSEPPNLLCTLVLCNDFNNEIRSAKEDIYNNIIFVGYTRGYSNKKRHPWILIMNANVVFLVERVFEYSDDGLLNDLYIDEAGFLTAVGKYKNFIVRTEILLLYPEYCEEGKYLVPGSRTENIKCELCPGGRICLGSYLGKECTVKGTYVEPNVWSAICKICPENTPCSNVNSKDTCERDSFIPPGKSNEGCKECSGFCYSCTYTASKCTSCIDQPGIIYSNYDCICQVEDGYFINYESYNCTKCFPLCRECFGNKSNECYSCYSTKKAIKIGESTCACPEHYYYDNFSEKCEPCHILCANCCGPTFKECIGCNTALAMTVVDKPEICVYDCQDVGSYFRNYNNVCVNCPKHCMTCNGTLNNSCLSCKSELEVMQGGECRSKCDPGYFPHYGICYKCHETCLECKNGMPSGCTSCRDNLLYLEGKCVSVCPPETYKYIDDKNKGICLECEVPCRTCLSHSECTACTSGFYLNSNEYKCVPYYECPNGTYPNSSLLTCETCPEMCINCFGPTSFDCDGCNYKLGYNLNEEQNECSLLVCSEGMYMKINNDTNQKACCYPCYERCRNCKSSRKDECTECKQGFQPVLSDKTNLISCKTCEDLDEGFYTEIDGTCKEYCGDGLNLGQYECDDGNKIDGDGCSSKCTIEEGYQCFKTKGPDVCVDILAPTASLSVINGNNLVLTFSESVLLRGDDMNLANYLEVKLEGINCEYEWQLHDSFRPYKTFKKIGISVTPKCSLKGKAEVFIVIFKNASKITDLSNNVLHPPSYRADSIRFIYISDTQKYVVKSIGTAVDTSTLITFFSMLIISLFQNSGIGCFWLFINMIQFVSYITVIQCYIPYNLEVFLNDYLNIKKVTFPFDFLPEFIFNPLDFLSDFITKPFNERFLAYGYESLSFVFNFSEELFTWLLMGLIYLLLVILTAIFPKKR